MNARDARRPVILFDGVCGFCHASVRFVLKRDRAAAFRFAALESEAGRRLLADAHGETEGIDSMFLVSVEGDAFSKSDAALRVLAQLTFPWRGLARVARIVPRRAADALYDFVAARRRRWFAQYGSCPLPPEKWRDRFL